MSAPHKTQHKTPGTLTVVLVTVAFALFYAYDLFEAIANLIGVPEQIAEFNEFFIENGLTPQPVPWAVLIVNLLLPVLAFVGAVLLGRRRGLGHRILLLALGLCGVAALTLTLTALV